VRPAVWRVAFSAEFRRLDRAELSGIEKISDPEDFFTALARQTHGDGNGSRARRKPPQPYIFSQAPTDERKLYFSNVSKNSV
jgi:hypothetical protein